LYALLEGMGVCLAFTGVSSRDSHHRMEEHKLGNLNIYVAFVAGKKGTRN